MERLRLTVVIANLDHGALLEEAVPAHLAQSRPPDEILLIDDGSTDDSPERIERLARRDPRIRWRRNRCNLGPLVTYNDAAREARGDLLYFSAADDLPLPGFYERTVRLLERHPRAGLAVADYLWLKPNLETREQSLPLPRSEAYYAPDELAALLHGEYLPSFAAVLRKDAFLAAGGYRLPLEEIADWFLVHTLALRHGLCYSRGPGMVWRLSLDSWSRRESADPRRRRRKIHHLLGLLQEPAQRDVLPRFVRSASLLHVAEDAALAFLEAPELWTPAARLLVEPCLRAFEAQRERERRAAGRLDPSRERPAGGFDYRHLYRPEYLRPRIRELVEAFRAQRKRVVLFGAGEHTTTLFRLTEIARADLVAIADSAPPLQGECLFGLPVVAPEDIAALRADVVLISSVSAQAEIRATLAGIDLGGAEVVGVYPDHEVKPAAEPAPGSVATRGASGTASSAPPSEPAPPGR